MSRDLLDQSKLAPFLRRYFADTESERLVGRNCRYDSGYYDIIRFFGKQAADPSDIRLRFLTDEFRFEDDCVRQFSQLIEEQLRQQGRLTEGPPVMKLVAFENDVSPMMTVQAARYGDFAGSCFALDQEHPLFADWGGTLRDYYKAAFPTHEIAENPLALCLGVSGLIRIREAGSSYILRVRRAAHLATMTGSFGSSVAGVVDYDSTCRNLKELMVGALSQEVEEEINLAGDEYTVIPLAYTREILRGEHPQLFCLVDTNLTRQQISARLGSLEQSAREFDRFNFLPLLPDNTLSHEDIDGLNFEGRINYYLAEEYLAEQD